MSRLGDVLPGELLVLLQWMAFGAFSVGAVWLSRYSLLKPRAYGFARFFAFELIFALLIRAAPFWFADPLAIRQVASWILLLASGALAVHGFYLLHTVGQPSEDIETTTVFVQQGAYRWIRHPLYLSLMLLAWGCFLKMTDSPGGLLVIGATALLVITARVEEAENMRKFGAAYEDYCQRTKMFIPTLF